MLVTKVNWRHLRGLSSLWTLRNRPPKARGASFGVNQGQRSRSKGTSSAYGPRQEFGNRGQRNPATETDAHFTRNVGHVASVVIGRPRRLVDGRVASVENL